MGQREYMHSGCICIHVYLCSPTVTNQPEKSVDRFELVHTTFTCTEEEHWQFAQSAKLFAGGRVNYMHVPPLSLRF